MLDRKPENICVVRLSAIGDTCHALAVIRRLQDNWPELSITWIIGKTEATLMDGIDGVDLVVFDKRKGRKAYADVRNQLGNRRFDVALCMHASFRVNWLYPSLNAPLRLGFDRARAKDFQWLFTNARVAARPREHALDAMMGFATAIGADETPLRWDIPVDDAARNEASIDVPYALISPCSSIRARNFRNWPVERYIDIVRYLEDERGLTVVLTGGGTDVERRYGEHIAERTRADNRIGQTGLKTLLALIDGARFVICPDSGPAHMATTVDTPVVGLYATSNPERTGPYRSLGTVVNRYPDAARAFLDRDVDALKWGQRIRHEDAMNFVTIDDVRDKIDGILDQND